MPENKTDNMDALELRNSPVLFVHGKPAPAMVGMLVDTGFPVYAQQALPGCRQTQYGYGQPGLLLEEISNTAPDRAVVIIEAGLQANAGQLLELSRYVCGTSKPVARTVLSNAAPILNPFAGLRGEQVTDSTLLSATVDQLGPGLEHGHFSWPDHFVALSAAAVKALSAASTHSGNALAVLHEAGGDLSLSDRIFIYKPAVSLFNSTRLEPHETRRPPSWGKLSARLQDWLKACSPELSDSHASDKPVTLHITHSWGGGVALWTSTFIASDKDSRHLQLRSEGPQSGQGSGQCLGLYSGDHLECPLGQWWLQPPIQSVQESNAHYRETLDYICRRYAVGRVIVSSLVGHSLEALTTGLPTIQVLHDHFPVWPFLSAHPSDYLDQEGAIDFSAALSDHRLNKEFPDLSAGSWQAMRDSYLQAIAQNAVKLAAPGQSVIDLQIQLDGRWRDIDIQTIPHGLPPLKVEKPVVPLPRRDDRLRLVIPGRIQAGKGQGLLLKALPEILPHAQIYLLGTGKNGEAFFGIPGINVIIDYERKELPAILEKIGPDLAALLSRVPETYSYTLSEMQFLGIPTIATRVGSFPGRINHEHDGWLIEPAPEAFADLMAKLSSERGQIETVRRNVQALQPGKTSEMIAAYLALCPPLQAKETTQPIAGSFDQVQASALAYQGASEHTARLLAEQEAVELKKEVERRTDWALDSKRLLKEEEQRRKRREQWAHSLETEVDHHKEVIEKQTGHMELQERELVATRTRLGETAADLAVTKQVLDERETVLKQTSKDLEYTREVNQQILASTSWAITRPFRVLRRTARNFKRSQAWNPLRWPLLTAGLVRNLTTVGLRGTLMRMQFSGHESSPELNEVEKLPAVDAPNPPVSVPCSAQPTISIVIPAYNKWAYTAACLHSINEARCAQRIEVIVVDDESSDETELNVSKIEGLRNIRNQQNLGFIRSCNLGAEQAKGEFIVLLNNDTQVTDGWLDTLLETFNLFPDTGLAGSRLVYPDGTLQECGGMIFEDGSGWNYGRGDDPKRPEYQHVREVDYCSGASIMIRTELFRELGGFDEHFIPAYYEDTDLAFRIRSKGLKVRVQPASIVVHHEGVTSGTDTDSGIKRYQVVNREKFLERWKTELESYPPRIEDPTNPAVIRASRDHRLRGKVLLIDATTPEPDQDSGSVRLTQLMRCLRDMGYGVTFFAENHQHAGRYTRDIQQWGIEVVYQPWLESNQAFFEQRGAEFDYVMVSRHYIASNYVALARKYCPGTPFIFDTVDLHYLREQRLAELEDSLALKQVAAQTRRSELSVIERSDAVLVVSETEVDILAGDAPDAFVHVLSNIHDVPGCSVGFAERSDMFFVGGYQHPPNVDAALWFVNSIWPLIRTELPEATFHLIGSKAPDSIKALHGDGVIFHGFVEDLDQYLDHCRLALAPLRYGAGVKGKVNMSMSHGQPVVATPAAIEGIHAEHDRDVLVADSEQAFADEVVRIYRDEKLWQRISSAAIKNVESHFSVGAARDSLETLFNRLGKN